MFHGNTRYKQHRYGSTMQEKNKENERIDMDLGTLAVEHNHGSHQNEIDMK